MAEFFVVNRNGFVHCEQPTRELRKSVSLPAQQLEALLQKSAAPLYHVQEEHLKGSASTVSTSTNLTVESFITGRRLSVASQLSDRNSVSSAENLESSRGSIADIAKDNEVPEESKTTVMIRNIPCRYAQDELIAEITMLDLPFNFLYLPPSRHSGGNLGYAFVNFVEPEMAELFIQ